ncbi:MAG: PQQ-binding-like beta-propeller repeat protein, partial [Planctomycetota bacterium]
MYLKIAVFALLILVSSSVHADWMRFRGPNGSGVSDEKQATPAEWSAQKNLKWKAALPGHGSSSPIIVGDKVFVTCWSGYGMNRNDPGDQKDLRRHLVCLD